MASLDSDEEDEEENDPWFGWGWKNLYFWGKIYLVKVVKK